MTDFFKNVYVPAIKLHQYVFTREQACMPLPVAMHRHKASVRVKWQVERQMNSELFVHTPAEPPPLSAAVDNALAPAAEPTAAEHKSPGALIKSNFFQTSPLYSRLHPYLPHCFHSPPTTSHLLSPLPPAHPSLP